MQNTISPSQAAAHGISGSDYHSILMESNLRNAQILSIQSNTASEVYVLVRGTNPCTLQQEDTIVKVLYRDNGVTDYMSQRIKSSSNT